jgi:hypothetical protein
MLRDDPANFLMELLLNLAWLLLALPACWLWRDARTAPAGRKFTSFQCLLAIGCILVILFPVVSATDDLRAMRTEMEESPASKRSVCQSSGEESSASRWQSQPGLVAVSTFFVPADRSWLRQPVSSLSRSTTPAVERASRAPPRAVLA